MHFAHLPPSRPSPRPQDILAETAKGVVFLMIMERLFLTSNFAWLEARQTRARTHTRTHARHAAAPSRCRGPDQRWCARCVSQEHVDYLSIQALLYKRATLLTLGQQTALFWRHTKRLG